MEGVSIFVKTLFVNRMLNVYVLLTGNIRRVQRKIYLGERKYRNISIDERVNINTTTYANSRRVEMLC